MIKFLEWLAIEKLFQVGDCCGSCRDYEKCFKGHAEYEKQNTLEHPACDSFKDR